MAKPSQDYKKIASTLYKNSKEAQTLYGDFARQPQVGLYLALRAMNTLLGVLLSSGSTRGVKAIVAEYEKMILEDLPVGVATVTSVIPLDELQIQTLSKLLREQFGYSVAIQNKVDPALTGGLIIKVGDQVIDASLHGQFKNLAHKLQGEKS